MIAVVHFTTSITSSYVIDWLAALAALADAHDQMLYDPALMALDEEMQIILQCHSNIVEPSVCRYIFVVYY